MGHLNDWWYRFSTPWIPVEEIHRRLGRPRSILCLGNGPSSGDSSLARESFDVLLRINPCRLRWHEGGPLSRPHAVFLAREEANFLTMREATAAGWTPEPLVLMTGRKGVRHAREAGLAEVMDNQRIDFWLNRERVRFRPDGLRRRVCPTNGMIMLALAAALQPRRLVVAGFDLYSHPAGDYPGSPEASTLAAWQKNGSHSLALERWICLRALAGEYCGELVVYGDPLRQLLAGQAGKSLPGLRKMRKEDLPGNPGELPVAALRS